MASTIQSASPRRRIIRILSFVVVFFGTMAGYRYFTLPPKYQPKYQTSAHRFLDLQGKYVSIPDESYELLDDVITTAKSRIHYDATIKGGPERERQFLVIFNTIDSILIEKNFIFPSGQWTCTLGEALEDHQLNARELQAAMAMPHNARRVAQMQEHADESFHLTACEPNAFLYLGIAEALGFELQLVDLPQHIFVRAPLDKDHWVNWDPNRGRSIGDQDYARGWGVEDWQIREKIFLHPLSADEVNSEMYTAVGWYLGDHSMIRGLGPAIQCYRKAIGLNPRNEGAQNNLARALLFRLAPDSAAQTEALESAQRCVAMEPHEADFHRTLAFAFAGCRQTAAAVAELHRALVLDPQDTEAAQMLPSIESGHTMYEAYKAESPIKFWIEYEYGWLYLPIGIGGAVGATVIRVVRLRKARTVSAKPEKTPELAAA